MGEASEPEFVDPLDVDFGGAADAGPGEAEGVPGEADRGDGGGSVRGVDAVERSGAAEGETAPAALNGGEKRRVLHSDANIEQFLIEQWGQEAYFDSAFYKAMLIENERQKRLEPLRKAYLKGRAAA